jgi:GcrA cell cycle regulator
VSAALRPVVALQRRAGSPWPAGDAELVRRWQAWETQEAIAEAMDLPVHQVRERVRRLRAHGVALRTGKTTKPGSRWDDAADQRLRSLWDDGHSTEEIARRMGTTKNSVVGRAHRLDLLGRPSPIRRGRPAHGETNAAYLARIAQAAPRSHNQGPRAPLPPSAATLPPLASMAPVAAPSTDHGWRFEPLHQKPGAGGVPSVRLLSPVAPRAPASGSGHPTTAATKGAAQAVTGGVTAGRVVTPPAAPRPPPAAAAPHRVPVQHVRKTVPAARYGRVTGCAWPLDDWRRPGRFVSCDAPSLPGRPYCGEHCERAYQRAPTRREDAHA